MEKEKYDSYIKSRWNGR